MLKDLKENKVFASFLVAFVAAVAMIACLTYGTFWPSVKMSVKELPIGIVSLDKGISQPQEINIGKNFVDKINETSSEAVDLIVYDDEDAAVNAVDNKDIYAYLVIPSDFTTSILSLISGNGNATPPVITSYINEGMNYSGVSAAQNILNTMTAQIQSGVQAMLLNMATQNNNVVSADTVNNLLTPFTVNTVNLHAIGNGGSGTIPMMLCVFLWMGALLSTLLIWRNTTKIEDKKKAVLIQLASGILLSVILSFINLFIIGNIMGLTINNYWPLYGFVVLVGFVFFLLQSNILNWTGMKGWPLLLMIWLFGMSAFNLPPQFLNDFTKNGVYSWSPYRFAGEAFRDILYYNSQADFPQMATIVGIAGGVLLALLLLYMFKRNAKSKKDIEAS